MRIVHYINQFFGQIGGESEADYPLEVRPGPVGPGLAFQAAFSAGMKAGGDDTDAEAGGRVEIVATIICGDNYFVENTERLTDRVAEILKTWEADLLLAGPAFNAGRYGMACGNVCKIAFEQLGLTAVSGMFPENPGAELYRKYAYIVPTADSARGMRQAAEKISTLVLRLAAGEKIGSPEQEGYIRRGIRVNFFHTDNAAKRATDMLLKKIKGEPFETELPMPVFDKFPPSPAIREIKNATIALITSGGIVPKGNPDRMEACNCTKYRAYTLGDFGGEELPLAEVAHGGYDPVYANEDGNRVLPVDALYALEKAGEIGRVHEKIYVTVGNGMRTDQAATFGDIIAKELLAAGDVEGVILTST